MGYMFPMAIHGRQCIIAACTWQVGYNGRQGLFHGRQVFWWDTTLAWQTSLLHGSYIIHLSHGRQMWCMCDTSHGRPIFDMSFSSCRAANKGYYETIGHKKEWHQVYVFKCYSLHMSASSFQILVVGVGVGLVALHQQSKLFAFHN